MIQAQPAWKAADVYESDEVRGHLIHREILIAAIEQNRNVMGLSAKTEYAPAAPNDFEAQLRRSYWENFILGWVAGVSQATVLLLGSYLIWARVHG